MPQKPILISGAGLVSLLLARSLRQSNIPFQIFERDANISFRGQGYRLRLSKEGLDAIESVLGGPDGHGPGWQKFWDACGKTGGAGFAAINARTGEDMKKGPPSQQQQQQQSSGSGSGSGSGQGEEQKKEKEKKKSGSLASRDDKIIGIARGEMRRLFLEGCEDFVHWGRQVSGYELAPDGSGVKAIFTDGTKSEEGAMLIGGEGIRSDVAKQLSGGKLKVFDTGARGIHGQAPTTAFKGLGEGVFQFFDDDVNNNDESESSAAGGGGGGRVFAITNVRANDMDDPTIEFGWTMIGQPGVIQAPNDDYSIVGKAAADIAKALTSAWHPRIKPLFDDMVEKEAAFWKITCSTPSGVPEWPNEPRVTLIGDAVHSMTPAGGIGANTAVRDSALLGRLIAEAGGYKEGVTAAYEKDMRVYASEAVAQSYGMAKSTFGLDIDEESSPTV